MNAALFLFKQKVILYIEDDKLTRENTTSILKLMFKEVHVAASAEEGMNIFDDENIDLILADIGLPGQDGLTFVKNIRAENYSIPIVMLTSMTAQEQLMSAANLAVDGYILKPFDLNNLLKVLSKAFNRGSATQQIVDFGDARIFNVTTKEMSVEGEMIPLGKKERELLMALIMAHPRTLSSEELTSKLWPLEEVGDSALKNLIMRMRKKLGDELILSVKSAGYRVNLV